MQSIQTLSPLDQANLQEAARLQGFWTPKGYVGMLMRKIGLSILGSSHMAQTSEAHWQLPSHSHATGHPSQHRGSVIPAF